MIEWFICVALFASHDGLISLFILFFHPLPSPVPGSNHLACAILTCKFFCGKNYEENGLFFLLSKMLCAKAPCKATVFTLPVAGFWLIALEPTLFMFHAIFLRHLLSISLYQFFLPSSQPHYAPVAPTCYNCIILWIKLWMVLRSFVTILSTFPRLRDMALCWKF